MERWAGAPAAGQSSQQLVPLGEGSQQCVPFGLKSPDLIFKLQYPPDSGERHPLVGKLGDVPHDRDLGAGVAPLTAR